MTTNTEAISTDRMLRVMADQRRRKVLRHLLETGESPVTVDELARDITHDESSAQAFRGDPDQVVVELHHAHLPKLTELGVVEYDPHQGRVEYRPHDDVEDLLQAVSRFE